MMWSEKHRPRDIPSMVGNEEARAALSGWFSKWKKGTKPVLLVGPPGTGKTTVANLAAKAHGYDVISLNASDARSKSRINEVLSPVLGNVSVLGSPMIFIDEVDGIHGRSDFGGAEALIKILKEPAVPIVLAANSDASPKMKSIKKTSKLIPFRPLPPRLMRVYLRKVLSEEGASLSPGAEIKVISESRGDIRSMLNLAQSLAGGFDPPTEKSFEKLDVEAGINAFFKAKTPEEARAVLYAMQIDPREKIGAFYSSVITSSLPAGEMSRVLRVISDADVLYGRIRRTQQWRLLRYLDGILAGAFSPEMKVRYTQYNLPWPLLNRLRWDGKSLGEVFGVMGGIMHTSRSAFGTFYFPYMLQCIKNKKFDPGLEEGHAEVLEKEVARLG
ncbi:replication factor C/ATPase involved in DNA replication [Cenarchaeum symbiosum A]|uniref:Replication factor C/ATPase involved in DNA replication n=1 Tax=Cenarchaeum symbiosum (strain A) TaxID=414004 RepID=A0RY55_CENSY|nr:replication factor C/ATPase involved in DNA replication [Cenarchaeum symbiosum A]